MNAAAAFLYTRGAEGAALYVGDQTWRATPPAITVVDTVGAGDCSLAGLLCSLLYHPDSGWDAHLRASVAAGTGACLAAGATPPSAELLARLAGQVQVRSG
jgi:fructokinase